MEECAEVSLARALINGADSMGGPAVDAAAEDISVSGFVDEANRYVVNVCAEKIGNARW